MMIDNEQVGYVIDEAYDKLLLRISYIRDIY